MAILFLGIRYTEKLFSVRVNLWTLLKSSELWNKYMCKFVALKRNRILVPYSRGNSLTLSASVKMKAFAESVYLSCKMHQTVNLYFAAPEIFSDNSSKCDLCMDTWLELSYSYGNVFSPSKEI